MKSVAVVNDPGPAPTPVFTQSPQNSQMCNGSVTDSGSVRVSLRCSCSPGHGFEKPTLRNDTFNLNQEYSSSVFSERPGKGVSSLHDQVDTDVSVQVGNVNYRLLNSLGFKMSSMGLTISYGKPS